MNPTIIAKYSVVDWYFAIYKGIELQEIYRVTPQQLKPYFSKWEKKWYESDGKDINNPKIPVQFVRNVGVQVYVSQQELNYLAPVNPPSVSEAELGEQ